MRILLLIFLVFSGLQVQAQLSPVEQDTFPWYVNYRLPTRVVGTKAPSSIFVMDSTQTKLRAIPTDSITSYIPRNEILGYKEYVALLSQSGTDAPVATVLYNDLGGTVVWTYAGVGGYAGTLAGAFTLNKTDPAQYPILLGADYTGLQEGNFVTLRYNNVNTILLESQIADGTPTNGFGGVLVRIRVYN